MLNIAVAHVERQESNMTDCLYANQSFLLVLMTCPYRISGSRDKPMVDLPVLGAFMICSWGKAGQIQVHVDDHGSNRKVSIDAGAWTPCCVEVKGRQLSNLDC